MMKKMFLTFALLFAFTAQAIPQSQMSPFSLSILPDASFPLATSADYFQTGYGGLASLEYRLPFVPFIFAAASLGYSYEPTSFAESVSVFSGLLRVGARGDIVDWLTLWAGGEIGYYYAMVNGDSSFPAAMNPAIIGEAGVLLLEEPLRIDLGVQYRLYYGLYSGLSATAGLSWTLPVTTGTQATTKHPLPEKAKPLTEKQPTAAATVATDTVTLESIQLDTVFPILFKHYDDHTIGQAVVVNHGKEPVENVKVSFQIKQFMDAPKPAKLEATTLAPGESKKVELYALFTDQILQITESTKLAAEMTVSYVLDGTPVQQTFEQTVRVEHRNAMTWDDNRKAGAFVTAKDPAVLLFSNNVNAMVKNDLSRALDKNLQLAIALHDALTLYGISYVSNPLTPYSDISKNKLAVDTLKFPRQTFDYKSGDCSDLSILYCALLESLQVETAFITIPGHIFMAFSLNMSPDEARKAFPQADDLIFRNDKSWIPIEITEREGGFQNAWSEGAKEWRENLARQQADFYPLHEAWEEYEPAGFPGSAMATVQVPQAEKLLPVFQDEIHKFINKEIFGQVASLQAKIAKDKDGGVKTRNSLGVLYARYDLTVEAQTEFQRVLKQKEYLPSLINMGNLLYAKGSYEEALAFYQRAYKLDAKNPHVVLAIARVDHELEDYGQVKKLYTALKTMDPDLAQQFSYLDLRGEESVRAAEIGNAKGVVLWEE